MDLELARLRRLRQATPGDVSAALRLAANLDRCGRFEDAFDLLARLSGSVSQGEKGRDLRRALAELAASRPDAVLAHVRVRPYRESRLLLRALAECGELPVLVVLACAPDDRRADDATANRIRHLREHSLRCLARTRPGAGLAPGVTPAWIVSRVGKRRDWALVPWLATAASSEARAAFLLVTGRAEPPLDVLDVARRFRSDSAR